VAGRSYGDGESTSAAEALLNRVDRPTALFAANDRMLAQAMPLFGRLGLRVPDDLALVGYARLRLFGLPGTPPALNRARRPGACRPAASSEEIEKPSLQSCVVKEPVRLVVRRSCGAKRLPPQSVSA
jgi:LacI family transcriptional regulator